VSCRSTANSSGGLRAPRWWSRGTTSACPISVRYYLVSGTQHGGGDGVTTGLVSLPTPGSQCQLVTSPVAESPVWRALVPALIDWGRETSGILVPDLKVPLATYTGWNRRGGHAVGESCSFYGGTIPIAIDAAAKAGGHDSRPTLADLYRGRGGLLGQGSRRCHSAGARRLPPPGGCRSVRRPRARRIAAADPRARQVIPSEPPGWRPRLATGEGCRIV